MTDRVHYHPNLILSVGTQVVTLVDIPGSTGLVLHPRGTVGVVVKAPSDHEHSYRVRFPDAFEAALKRSEVALSAQFKEGELGAGARVAQAGLYHLGMRSAFLSLLIYQTYNGYVMSQFKKMQADIRNHGKVKWKHVMHLIRLLLSGIGVLRDGSVPVRVDAHRDRLLAIRRGDVLWE